MRELVELVEKQAGILEQRASALLADAEDLREQVGKVKRKLHEEAKAAHQRCPAGSSRGGLAYACTRSAYHPERCFFEQVAPRRRAGYPTYCGLCHGPCQHPRK